MKLKSQPETDDTVSGTEPWDLPSLLKDLRPHAAADMLACVDLLRTGGPSALTKEQRAFWLSYQNSAKSPLPLPGNVETELEQVHIDNAMTALKEAKPDVKGLDSALEQTEHSLVSRANNVGLFAKRGPVRLLALPDWCTAAVCVNTKARYVELISAGHNKLIQLPLLASAVVDGDWHGHRYRVRISGLQEIKNIHMLVNSLAVNTRG
jgi:hypothetical protein